MPKLNKISKNNTVILPRDDGSVSVILHQTEIVRHWPEERKVRLDTGRWPTATTRTRMMQCFHEWGIPLSVSFAGGVQTARHHDGTEYGFSRDGICYINY